MAIDCDKLGHPSLTVAEADQIRAMLARVKPCRRPLLRFGYWGANEVALFFTISPVDSQGHTLETPILGATNESIFQRKVHRLSCLRIRAVR